MLRSAIDSLFAGGRDGRALARSETASTLAQIYLTAMRSHERRAALLHASDGRWEETPDWRLDRQVIRLGLYLKERIGVKSADRVAIIAPVRREWALAQLATVVQGAVAVSLDPDLPGPALEVILTRLAPRAAFVADEAVLARVQAVRGGMTGPKGIIVFDAATETAGVPVLSEVLDLGGTLDTPERAQGFRAQAKAVKAEAEALGFVDQASDSGSFTFLTHEDAVRRLEALWFSDPPQMGDVIYLAHAPPSQGALLALLAAVGDGFTTAAVGSMGAEAAEIASLGPHRIVAAAHALRRRLSQADASNGKRSLVQEAMRLLPFANQRRRREAAQAALGGRARWVHPVLPEAGDAAALAPLRDVVRLEVQI